MTLKGLLLTVTFTLTTEEDENQNFMTNDDFTFPIVTFPFIGSNVLAAPAVGV